MSLLRSWNFIYNALLGIVKPVLRGHLRNKEKVALTYKMGGSSIHNKFVYDRTRKGDL
jgi:hypothetical protein